MPDGCRRALHHPDGSVVVYEGVRATADNAGEVGIFPTDPETGLALPDAIARLATSGYLAGAAVSGDGRYVTFYTGLSLDSQDTNDSNDIVVERVAV